MKNKVSQRLGVLQRIKHLLPRDTRELFVKAMVLGYIGKKAKISSPIFSF